MFGLKDVVDLVGLKRWKEQYGLKQLEFFNILRVFYLRQKEDRRSFKTVKSYCVLQWWFKLTVGKLINENLNAEFGVYYAFKKSLTVL